VICVFESKDMRTSWAIPKCTITMFSLKCGGRISRILYRCNGILEHVNSGSLSRNSGFLVICITETLGKTMVYSKRIYTETLNGDRGILEEDLHGNLNGDSGTFEKDLNRKFMEILGFLERTYPGKFNVDSRILEKDLHPKLRGDSGTLVKDVQWEALWR
jgi:hypothetical protein